MCASINFQIRARQAEPCERADCQLNAQVAEAIGLNVVCNNPVQVKQGANYFFFSPANDWTQAGLIIQQYGISMRRISEKNGETLELWGAWLEGESAQMEHMATAHTPTKAAMQALLKHLSPA